jgi:hypothetical protein
LKERLGRWKPRGGQPKKQKRKATMAASARLPTRQTIMIITIDYEIRGAEYREEQSCEAMRPERKPDEIEK